MTAEEALGLILSRACPGPLPDEQGFTQYSVDLHCISLVVTARSTGDVYDCNDDYKYSTFEVRSVEVDHG